MLGPIGSLIVGVILVVVLILALRCHAFLALILAALAVALVSSQVPVEQSLGIVTEGFGAMMAELGILLVLASIIGKCLMDSGGAERIVRAFNRLFGANREEYSLMASGFVLAVPVFFDVVFYLLAPLARAAYARRGRDYILLITVIGASAAVTHGLVPPTPGPIYVAAAFDVSIVTTMGVGLLVGIVPLLVGGLLWGYIINRFVDAKPGDVLGVSQEELTERAQKSDEELPSLMMSLLPFVFPVVLLTAAAVLKTYYPEDDAPGWLMLLGDKNLVFFAGAAAGLWLLFSQKTHSLRSTFASLEPAIASGAVIAFITSAGGAFGESLAQAGIGGLIAETAQDANISLLVLAFLTAALIRIAQGSATVAMTTTAGIIAPSLGLVELGFHPAYLVAVIGLAATGFSWMNDSGFWLVSKLTGLNEAQTLASFTASLSLVALSGFAWVWVLIQVLPLV